MIAAKAIIRLGPLIFLLVIAIAFIPVRMVFAGTEYTIQWQQGHNQLSLDLAQADIHQLLQQIAKEADFKLWVSPQVQPRSIDIQLQSHPLNKALERLLQSYSFALSYHDDATIKALYVLPPGQTTARLEVEADSPQGALMSRVLASKQLSDKMKSVLMHQMMSDYSAQQQSILSRRDEVMLRLVDHIERVGASQPSTIENLRNKLKKHSTAVEPQ